MGRKHQRRLEKSIREFRKEHNGQAPDSQDIKNIEKSYKKQRDENAREKKKEAREKDRKLAECRAAVEADMPFFTFKFGELDSLPDSFPSALRQRFQFDDVFVAAVKDAIPAVKVRRGKLRELEIDVVLWLVLTDKTKFFSFNNKYVQTRFKGFVLRALRKYAGENYMPVYEEWIRAHEEALNTPDQYEARLLCVEEWVGLIQVMVEASKDLNKLDWLEWFYPAPHETDDFNAFFHESLLMQDEFDRADAAKVEPDPYYVKNWKAANKVLVKLLLKKAEFAIDLKAEDMEVEASTYARDLATGEELAKFGSSTISKAALDLGTLNQALNDDLRSHFLLSTARDAGVLHKKIKVEALEQRTAAGELRVAVAGYQGSDMREQVKLGGGSAMHKVRN